MFRKDTVVSQLEETLKDLAQAKSLIKKVALRCQAIALENMGKNNYLAAHSKSQKDAAERLITGVIPEDSEHIVIGINFLEERTKESIAAAKGAPAS